MTKHKRWLSVLLAAILLLLPACTKPADTPATDAPATEAGSNDTGGDAAAPAGVDLAAVNNFLNTSAALGEGSKANPVAIIPFAHVDGPRDEDTFYAFVNFKFVSRNFIKYQVSYISCTCRPAAYNYWQTAYVELSLPESGKLDDVEIKTLSFDKDSEGKYLGGFWGDSDPIPNGTTYEQIKTEYIPYFVGKTWGQLKNLNFMEDIDLADYQAGDGRSALTIDTFSGASVSTNNIIRLLQAIVEFHGTDGHFSGEAAPAPSDDATETPATETTATETTGAAPAPAPGTAAPAAALPEPRDTTRTFKPTKDATAEVPCEVNSFSFGCSSITKANLSEFLNREDVLYIDLRDYTDYIKLHFRNFEVVPFFGLIWDKEAHEDESKIQLYGGDPKDPVANYEESDEILAALFPKDKTIFLLCQSGGRVAMLMDILEARGWDMSKIYNIGGMAEYTDSTYRAFQTDTIELGVEDNYILEGLTPVK